MKKKFILLTASFIALTFFASCGSDTAEKKEDAQKAEAKTDPIYATEGYSLMQQKCFICHLEKPDPAKKSTMIAPPMARVQQHYKPTYKEKEAFIQAITAWVANPSPEKAMMPGAIKKFNLMPHLAYPEEEVQKIAAVLYEIDFGQMPGRGMGMMNGKMAMMMQGPTLNNGKKWNISAQTGKLIDETIQKLNSFQSDKVEDYHQLGSDIFHNVKTIILDKSYSEDVSNQLHAFFHGVEGNLHFLISATNVEDARKRQENLKKTFSEFYNYFEVK